VLELFDLERRFCASNFAVAGGNVVLMRRQFLNLCLKEHMGFGHYLQNTAVLYS